MDDCRPGYFSAKGIDDDLESVPITCSCFTTTSLMVGFGLRSSYLGESEKLERSCCATTSIFMLAHLGLRFPSLFYPAVLFLDLGSNKPSFQIDIRTP